MYTLWDLGSIQSDLSYERHVAKAAARTTMALSIGLVIGSCTASHVCSFLC